MAKTSALIHYSLKANFQQGVPPDRPKNGLPGETYVMGKKQ
jgi:hypothetical protein